MEYKLVVKAQVFKELVKRSNGKYDGTHTHGIYELDDLNMDLEDFVKTKWTIKNSGMIVSGTDVLFWALLER